MPDGKSKKSSRSTTFTSFKTELIPWFRHILVSISLMYQWPRLWRSCNTVFLLVARSSWIRAHWFLSKAALSCNLDLNCVFNFSDWIGLKCAHPPEITVLLKSEAARRQPRSSIVGRQLWAVRDMRRERCWDFKGREGNNLKDLLQEIRKETLLETYFSIHMGQYGQFGNIRHSRIRKFENPEFGKKSFFW